MAWYFSEAKKVFKDLNFYGTMIVTVIERYEITLRIRTMGCIYNIGCHV